MGISLCSEGILQTGPLAWMLSPKSYCDYQRLCSQELVSNEVDYTLQGDKPHTHIEAAVSRP